MLHYYIYYRVQPEHVVQAEAAVKQIQSEIARRFGISGSLLKKRGEPNLWMETYPGLAPGTGFETALKQAEDKAGIAVLLRDNGARHVECFQD